MTVSGPFIQARRQTCKAHNKHDTGTKTFTLNIQSNNLITLNCFSQSRQTKSQDAHQSATGRKLRCSPQGTFWIRMTLDL